MKVILTKKNDDDGRLSVRDVSEEKAVWFCRTAVSKGLWMACRTNAKGVRLVAVFGKWEEVEDMYSRALKDNK
jgi:hypothetical protein